MNEENRSEVFISYSHDNPDHIHRVLQLSNKLRAEGIDCVLDQYEASPPEGWPRWTDRKIQSCEFVLSICTEAYYKRVMGQEEPGKGLGVLWEGNLVYQHLYNAGSMNNKFIPVLFSPVDQKHIPTPLQGATRYCVETDAGYDDLYLRLLKQPKVQKPKLGKPRPLPAKEVKTNMALLCMPIDVELWDQAKWRGTMFMYAEGQPPIIGLAFLNEKPAKKIFEQWHERYGESDASEELRISIVEGELPGQGGGYTVHVGIDPHNTLTHLREAGFDPEKRTNILMLVSRLNRMNPKPDSKNLQIFKDAYKRHKTYYLIPAVMKPDGSAFKPIKDLGIYKSVIHFRKAADVGENDIDSVIFGPKEES
ncbi:MAG: TIR domain-containing protein [Deltaproteobacteria bacterium]|nr:TIR domain-containing protein [Deltaproteobacteria bacterium]